MTVDDERKKGVSFLLHQPKKKKGMVQFEERHSKPIRGVVSE